MAKANASKTGEDKKSKCPVTREQFAKKAPVLKLTITDADGGVVGTMLLAPKDFKTGSFGFFSNDKLTVMVDGQVVKCQANILMTAVGSKDLPK